jgi:hypothetical protein
MKNDEALWIVLMAARAGLKQQDKYFDPKESREAIEVVEKMWRRLAKARKIHEAR